MKKLLLLLSLSLFLTGCSTPVTAPHEDVSIGRDMSLTETYESNNAIPTSTEIIEEVIEKKIEMTTLIVDDTTYTLPYSENNSVHDAMMNLTAMSSQPFSFHAQEYSGLGAFVDEINGKVQDSTAGKYWIYYINGQSAKVGISNYIIQQGDLIEWKYEKSTF